MTDVQPVLLLNDTDEGGTHFGCMRVMRTIRSELAKRGFDELPSVKVGTDWRQNQALLQQIDSAELVVINGEGTLHHGKRRGRWLLEAGARVKARGGRVALINALWQDNPSDWARLAQDFDILACRDSHSARDLGNATGREVSYLGDLSMFTPLAGNGEARHGIMVSCSVHGKVTEALASFARMGGHDFVPVTTAIKPVPARLSGWHRWLRSQRSSLQNRWFQMKYPSTRFVADDARFLAELSSHSLVVTGRFHAVCLAILSGTPFIAVSSNSWKIEALINDIGLDRSRLVPLKDLSQSMLTKQDWSYSEFECRAISSSLAKWRLGGAELFHKIASLTPKHPL